MVKIILLCEKCLWQGTPEEVEFYLVDTCTSTEKVEMCPKCGSLDIIMVKDTPSTDK